MKDNEYTLEEISKCLKSLSERYDIVVKGCEYYKARLNMAEIENNKLKEEKEKNWKNYQRNIQKKQDRINELERAYKTCNDDKARLVEYYQHEIKKLEEENEKLKLDCEKLQHGYNADMIFCGGRGNGKQYKALVELFKKIDREKVDAAYKEVYNTTLPVWQKEVLKQMYDVRKESKENPVWCTSQPTIKDQIDSLCDAWAYLKNDIYKIDEWQYKLPTKRQEMWVNIFNAAQNPPVDIKVAKQDIKAFLKELQDQIPKTRWNGSDCLPTEVTNPYWFKHDYIYFALYKIDDRGYIRMCYDENKHSWIDKPVIEYLPPMRWDLFKKGRIAVGVRKEDYSDFCEIILHDFNKVIIHSFDRGFNYNLFIFDKDNKDVKRVGQSQFRQLKEICGRRLIYWEDVK